MTAKLKAALALLVLALLLTAPPAWSAQVVDTISGAADSVTLPTADDGGVSISVQGSWSGDTLLFEGQVEIGANWTPLNMCNMSDSRPAISTPSGVNGVWLANIAGIRKVRVRNVNAVTGPANIVMVSTKVPGPVCQPLESTLVGPKGQQTEADSIATVQAPESVYFIGPSGTGGLSSLSGVAANSNNAATLMVGGGQVYGVQAWNICTGRAKILLYDQAGVPAPASDNANIILRYLVPKATADADAGTNPPMIFYGRPFTDGLGMAIVGGVDDTNNTSVSASCIIFNIFWKAAS